MSDGLTKEDFHSYMAQEREFRTARQAEQDRRQAEQDAQRTALAEKVDTIATEIITHREQITHLRQSQTRVRRTCQAMGLGAIPIAYDFVVNHTHLFSK